MEPDLVLALVWSTKPGVTVNPVWTPAYAAWWMRWTGTYKLEDLHGKTG